MREVGKARRYIGRELDDGYSLLISETCFS